MARLLLSFEGSFEAHLTVDAEKKDQARFGLVCAHVGAKPVLIEAPGAALAVQPMTSSYHRGALPEVLEQIAGMAARLEEAGFPVRRRKVEATLATRGVPVDEGEARALSDACYFEFHAKVALGPGDDLGPLRELCASLGARLSSNAFKVLDGGQQERFVTTRAYRVGAAAAEQRFASLLGALRAGGYRASHPLREFVVLDSNAPLDQGWF